MAAAAVEFRALRNLMGRGSELTGPGFEPDAEQNMALLQEHLKILIVGAGGLGCEMLKVREVGARPHRRAAAEASAPRNAARGRRRGGAARG